MGQTYIKKGREWLIFAGMIYKVIGLMSGSSLDGLDIAYVHLLRGAGSLQVPGQWEFNFVQTACYPYPAEWRNKLANAPGLSALEYQLLHTEYGHYLGQQVNRFMEEHGLQYQVQLIASHGHTSFHLPGRKMTAQLGDGAALAAMTQTNVVSDLRAMDLALGGQGAPIVPIGEKLLLPGYDYFLNLGGIANISCHATEVVHSEEGARPTDAGYHSPAAPAFVAFDVCPANRVLNALATMADKPYDEGGMMAAAGQVNTPLLQRLNGLSYYDLPYPKSLANEFGIGTVLPLVRESLDAGLSTADALRTYVEHIADQVGRAVEGLMRGASAASAAPAKDGEGAGRGRMLVTGGGAHNAFLVERLRHRLGVDVVVPDARLADYKEALIMALIGVLRWREENNVMASVTGASRDSIGGAVWIGQEA
jgi:anhydro-N-acetylmuramic acid kinase